MKRLWIPAFAFFLSLSAHAGVCGVNSILTKILGTRDQTTEWLAKRFPYQDVKNFDADLYYKSLDEFEDLKVSGQTPKQPPASELERSTAWLDAQTSTPEKLTTVAEILQNGTASQKVRLDEWIERVSKKPLTEFQIQQAATELSLLLHNTKYSLYELSKHGASELAKKMVTSQYHEAVIQQQLLSAMKDSDWVKKENILNAFNRIRQTSPMKWMIAGGSNTYSVMNVRQWTHLLLLSLPDHQWAKLSLDDLEILIKTGGVESPHFAEIAEKYRGKVEFQAFYNSAQDLIGQVSKALWIQFGIHKYEEHKKHKAEIDAKDHS